MRINSFSCSDICLAFTAMKVLVTSRDTLGEWVKFTAEVQDVYKQGRYQIKRGRAQLWVSMTDLACKCPKIRLNRQYLISSKDSKSAGRTGFTLSRRSKVVAWKDKLQSRLLRFRQNFQYNRCPRTRASGSSSKRYRSGYGAASHYT